MFCKYAADCELEIQMGKYELVSLGHTLDD